MTNVAAPPTRRVQPDRVGCPLPGDGIAEEKARPDRRHGATDGHDEQCRDDQDQNDQEEEQDDCHGGALRVPGILITAPAAPTQQWVDHFS